MSLVDYTVKDAVATIELNRPPVNALNREFTDAIGEAVGRAEDPEVRAVVITGSPHFAAGADISGFLDGFDGGGPEERQSAGVQALATRIAALTKPTIAAVHGYALGGGLELAMGADLRYLADDAKVGQPEIRLGIIPGAGGTQRLSRIVGMHRARELCMTGRHVTADEALALGLADAVFPDDELNAAAAEAAASFAVGPTRAYAAVKRAVAEGFDRTIEEGLAIEAEEFAQVFDTEDARIGVKAFLDKETPDFVGH